MKIELQSDLNSILRTYTTYLMSLFLYCTLIAFLFIKWTVPVYGYLGYTVNYNLTNVIISSSYIMIIGCLLVIQANNIKIFFILMLVLQVVVPMLCLYCFTDEFMEYNLYMFIVIICVLVISIICFIKTDCKDNFSCVSFSSLFLPLMTIITLFTLARYVVLNGLGIFNLDISRVYDYRLLLRESMTGILAYLDSWVVKIINPFCIVYSLHLKKKKAIVFYVILQVLLFGFSSHKSVLFSVFVLVGFYYITPFLQRYKWTAIWVFILACISSLPLYFKEISGMWCSIFRRVFFTPATLNFYYYEYFSMNSFDWFRQSFLRHFISSNYDLLLPRIIGFEYYGNMETNANTGFLGVGYAQGGFVILIIYSVIIGLLINIIASLTKKVPPGLAIGITILPMSSVYRSSDLPGTLVTGGLVIALLLLYTVSRDPTIK